MNEQSPQKLLINEQKSALTSEQRIENLEKQMLEKNAIIEALAEKLGVMEKKLERVDEYSLTNRHYIENHEHVNQ